MSSVPTTGPVSGAAPAVVNATPSTGVRAIGKLWGGSQGAVFAVQIIYLTILAALAIIYFLDRSLIGLPDTIGPISIAVPWFGALGAVLISLVGITDHRNDWDPSYRFWHWARHCSGPASVRSASSSSWPAS